MEWSTRLEEYENEFSKKLIWWVKQYEAEKIITELKEEIKVLRECLKNKQ